MNYFALITILAWPIIPLLWVPLHLFTGFFRRWGRWTYVFSAICWGACALLLYSHRDLLLAYTVKLPRALATIGMVMLLGGGILQALTVRILGFAGITGGHELDNRQDVFRSSGVFGAVRHPTYLAHTIILLGIFFITRNATVGIVALLDFLVAYFVIIPLEERELLKRFGPAFDEYRQRTPRFFPRIRL